MKRLGTVIKARPVTVTSAQQSDDGQTDQSKSSKELQPNHTAILVLTAQMSALTNYLERIVKHPDSEREALTNLQQPLRRRELTTMVDATSE